MRKGEGKGEGGRGKGEGGRGKEGGGTCLNYLNNHKYYFSFRLKPFCNQTGVVANT